LKEAPPSFWGSADMFVFEEIKWWEEIFLILRGGRRCLIERGFLSNQKKSPKQKRKKKENVKGGKKGNGKKFTSECS